MTVLFVVLGSERTLFATAITLHKKTHNAVTIIYYILHVAQHPCLRWCAWDMGVDMIYCWQLVVYAPVFFFCLPFLLGGGKVGLCFLFGFGLNCAVSVFVRV